MATTNYWSTTANTSTTASTYTSNDLTSATATITYSDNTGGWYVLESGDHYYIDSGSSITWDSSGYVTLKETSNDIKAAPVKETRKERKARLKREGQEKRRQKRLRYEAKKRAEKAKQAEEKAVKLLESLIGEEIDVYKKTGRVFVKGNNGTEYIVRKGRSLQKIEDKKVIDLCVHLQSKYKCPATDNVIGLKMLLENDEDHILKLANHIGSTTRPKELPLAACM